MAHITTDLILASTPHVVLAKNETIAHFLKRVSHLNLQHHGLSSLAGVEACPSLRALYAYGNRITEIPDGLGAIEVLVLDGNAIREITSLEQSPRLRKLHLDRNALARVGGLSACTQLEELHVAHQAGLGGDAARPLEFEPASLLCISRSVRWIDVSGCGLASLRPLAPCRALTRLDAADNELADLSELLSLLHGSWPAMEQLDLRGNAGLRDVSVETSSGSGAGAAAPYWDLVVASGPDSLAELDSRPVAPATRVYVRAMARKRGVILPGDFEAQLRRAQAQQGQWGAGGGAPEQDSGRAPDGGLAAAPLPYPKGGASPSGSPMSSGGGAAAGGDSELLSPSSSSSGSQQHSPHSVSSGSGSGACPVLAAAAAAAASSGDARGRRSPVPVLPLGGKAALPDAGGGPLDSARAAAAAVAAAGGFVHRLPSLSQGLAVGGGNAYAYQAAAASAALAVGQRWGDPPLPDHADPEGQFVPARRPTRTPGDFKRGSRFRDAARAEFGAKLHRYRGGAANDAAGAYHYYQQQQPGDSDGGGGGVSSDFYAAAGLPLPTRSRPLRGSPRASAATPRGSGGAAAPGGTAAARRPPSVLRGGPLRFASRPAPHHAHLLPAPPEPPGDSDWGVRERGGGGGDPLSDDAWLGDLLDQPQPRPQPQSQQQHQAPPPQLQPAAAAAAALPLPQPPAAPVGGGRLQAGRAAARAVQLQKLQVASGNGAPLPLPLGGPAPTPLPLPDAMTYREVQMHMKTGRSTGGGGGGGGASHTGPRAGSSSLSGGGAGGAASAAGTVPRAVASSLSRGGLVVATGSASRSAHRLLPVGGGGGGGGGGPGTLAHDHVAAEEHDVAGGGALSPMRAGDGADPPRTPLPVPQRGGGGGGSSSLSVH